MAALVAEKPVPRLTRPDGAQLHQPKKSDFRVRHRVDFQIRAQVRAPRCKAPESEFFDECTSDLYIRPDSPAALRSPAKEYLQEL
jgi:hypothetical protein